MHSGARETHPAEHCTLLHMHLISACLFTTTNLLAQAGGGGHYGGGGAGGGGSNGDGALLFWLIRFTIQYPYFGIPLIAGGCFVLYQLKKAESGYRVTRTIRRGRRVQEEDLRVDALSEIRQRDPQFTKEVFLDRVRTAFLTTQQAWSDQDLRSCRAFISDGVHERFDLYVQMQKTEDIRNRMKDLDVVYRDIVCVTSDAHFDTIHVRITASAISYEESLTTGRRVGERSDRVPISFTEIWSFSRRPGVPTNPQTSVLEGRCPSCGGPVEIVDRATCPQCQAIVNSGQHDWVLAEITQDQEMGGAAGPPSADWLAQDCPT